MFLFAFILVFGFAYCDENVTDDKIEPVKVDVYYESLCPDSKEFITKQLNPILNTEIANNIKLNIIPYGKSSTKKTENKFEFVCHHGEFECVGNKYHACALKLIKDDKKSLNYVNCMMENIYFDEEKKRRAPIDKCKETLKENDAEVSKCAESNQGEEFLAEYGKLTDEFQKPLKSVPTIVFNGKYDAEESKKSYEDFKGILCEKFGKNKPKDCA